RTVFDLVADPPRLGRRELALEADIANVPILGPGPGCAREERVRAQPHHSSTRRLLAVPLLARVRVLGRAQPHPPPIRRIVVDALILAVLILAVATLEVIAVHHQEHEAANAPTRVPRRASRRLRVPRGATRCLRAILRYKPLGSTACPQGVHPS